MAIVNLRFPVSRKTVLITLFVAAMGSVPLVDAVFFTDTYFVRPSQFDRDEFPAVAAGRRIDRHEG